MTTSFTAQVGFRGRSGDTVSLNDNTTWAALQNTNWSQDVDVTFRVRFEVEEQNNKNEVVGWVLEYNLGGAGWNSITTTSSVVKAVASGQFNEGDATTNILTASAKTFVAGEGVEDGSGTGIGLQNTHSEYEYAIQIVSGDVQNNDTIQLRIAGLDGYTVTPTITVVESAASQNLTGTLFSDSDSFGSHIVTAGTVTLTATQYIDADGFGAHAIAMNLVGILYQDTDDFGIHTVTPQAVTLIGTLYQDSDSFWISTISQGGAMQDLTGTLYNDPDFFGSHIVQPGSVTLAGTVYNDANIFGLSTIIPGAVTLAGIVYSDLDSFGIHVINQEGGSQNLVGARYNDPDVFGSHTIIPGAIILSGVLYSDMEIFGSHIVSQEGAIMVMYTGLYKGLNKGLQRKIR